MSRIVTLELLVPQFRVALEHMLDALAAEQIPLTVFESARPPVRQAELYARGRNPALPDYGRTVTRAMSWQSAHQWGLAADLVFRVEGRWTWEEPEDGMWTRMHELAEGAGLHVLRDSRGLPIEMPHVQLGTTAELRRLERGPNDTGAWLEWLRARVGG